MSVEASNPDEAIFVALKITADRFPADVYFENPSAYETLEDARLSTYTCMFCKHQNAKEAWGPGRITCPSCKRQQQREAAATEKEK